MTSSCRRRAISARRSSIRSAPRKMGAGDDPMAVLDERLRVRGRRAAAGHRRLGDAAHHLRQHQFADHHDRREGRRDGARGRAALMPRDAIRTRHRDHGARSRRRAGATHGLRAAGWQASPGRLPDSAGRSMTAQLRPLVLPGRRPPVADRGWRPARRPPPVRAARACDPAGIHPRQRPARRRDRAGARRAPDHRGDQIQRRRFPGRPEMAGLPRISATGSISPPPRPCRSRSCRRIAASSSPIRSARRSCARPPPPLAGRPPQGRDAALRPRRPRPLHALADPDGVRGRASLTTRAALR